MVFSKRESSIIDGYAIKQVFESLDLIEKLIVLRLYVKGMTTREVAKSLQIARSHLERKITAIRKKIRVQLKDPDLL